MARSTRDNDALVERLREVLEYDPDNRWDNLRAATRAQNMSNTTLKPGVSGVRGVSKSSSGEKWAARITVNNKRHNLGSFSTLEEAAEAYAKARKKFLGEFA